MKRLLLAGFTGNGNSAKVLLDKCPADIPKLYLENDFQACAGQIRAAALLKYDFIIAFGRKPVVKAIYIELEGRRPPDSLATDFDYPSLARHLASAGYRVKISTDAGGYLCNHVYFHGLRAILDSGAWTKMIFIHLPDLKNITDIDDLVCVFADYFPKLM